MENMYLYTVARVHNKRDTIIYCIKNEPVKWRSHPVALLVEWSNKHLLLKCLNT